jgi:hypothetical protein
VSIITTLLLLSFVPTSLKAITGTDPTTATPIKTENSKEAEALLLRLTEIKNTDKSNMSFSEKKKLRKETRAIKSQLKAIGGGIYLSVGAIIVILLLLILLL